MATPAEDCIFCKIVRREAPASVVYEDDATMAFMDIQPVAPGHTLVIPKKHGAYLGELPAGAAGSVLEAARKIAVALRRSGLRCEAVSLYIADGREAGQEVFHVHMHLIPRFRGDGFGLRTGPDFGRIAGPDELDDIGAKIRGAIGPQ